MEEQDAKFDREYVSQLRSEAANYRTKVKDLESKLEQYSQLEAEIRAVRVENELTKRGVQADPRWVPLDRDDDPAKAVDEFLDRYPHLKPQQDGGSSPRIKDNVPDPLKGNSNQPAPNASKGAFQGRSIDEIRQDPAARRNLADLYRELLARESHHTGE